MKKDIDTTKPQSGRIYDYLLGGTQNFEADRMAAEAMKKVLPNTPVMARLNRWFLQMVASRWAQEGQTRVLDLGSGLPTQGHFNDYVTDGRILFVDNDVLTAEYGEELLKDRPNMGYVHADIRESVPLLEAAAKFFGNDRKLGVGVIGVSYFLSDEELRALMQGLHAFCAPGSTIAASFVTPGPAADELVKVGLRMVNLRVHPRTPEQFAELIAPWRTIEHAPLEEWLSVSDLVNDEEVRANKLKFTGLFAAH